MDEWAKQYLGTWTDTNDYVFSQEQVYKLLEAGRIDKNRAEYLLRLRYQVRPYNGKLEVRDEDDCRVDLEEIRYYLALL